MPFGSQSNRAPELPVASRSYRAARPAGSSAARFRPAAATRIPASRRFPERHRPPKRRGLSIPARCQKKLRAARARYVRRPAHLRARSDKQPARRFASSGPPQIQNRDPVLPPHPAAAPYIPAKLPFPELPRGWRCAPRNTTLHSGCSKFFLGDHNSRSGPFIGGEFRGYRKSASPHQNSAACQHGPASALPPGDALLVQQPLQLVRAPVSLRAHSVTGSPVAQNQWEAQPLAIQYRPFSTSFPSLARPVNHLEAEYAPQFSNAYFGGSASQIDFVLKFARRAVSSSQSGIFYGLKHQRIRLFSHFYSARQSE